MTCSSDTTIKLWNVAHEKCLATLVEHTDYVKALAYAPHRSVKTGQLRGGGGGAGEGMRRLGLTCWLLLWSCLLACWRSSKRRRMRRC